METIMKHLGIGYGIVSVLLITTNVWAAEGVRQDNSGIFVWAFLGMCALIVMAQLVPALMLLVGLIKGAVASVSKKEATAESTSNRG